MRLFSWRTWRLGIKSLTLHPLRSLLTILGIFIGVSSVIWLLAIGEGFSRKTQEQIASLGANNIIIVTKKPPENTSGTSFSGFIYGLTRSDFKRLKNTIPTVKNAIPVRDFRYRFAYGKRSFEGRLVGCTPEYAEINQLRMAKGHFLTSAEVHTGATVCVLAKETAERLFAYEDPIGKSVRVGTEPNFYFEVVGVLEHREASGNVGGSISSQDYSEDIYIPITTWQQRIGDFVVRSTGTGFSFESVELNQITLQVKDTRHVLATAELVDRTLAKHHKQNDYSMVVPYELLERARVTKLLFMVFMGLIAAISLVVGGIGIMNIMLATVTERTREIGIRRALGAGRLDIVLQFLAETVVLSIAGGLTGILGGFLCGPAVNIVRYLLQWLMEGSFAELPEFVRTVEPILVPESIPLAFGISVLIGVVFGLYPAIRASLMDPVEALRHE